MLGRDNQRRHKNMLAQMQNEVSRTRDIVERLRAPPMLHNGAVESDLVIPLMQEAAEEIDRLRLDREALSSAIERISGVRWR
jgi:hypothetical protein